MSTARSYRSISAPDAAALADALNEQADGWEVIGVVNGTDNSVCALLRVAPATQATSADTTPASTTASTGAASTAGSAYQPAPAQPAYGAQTTAAYGSQTATPYQQHTPAPARPAVPAGWYADPAGRFELRYWDGSAWTEHVSRAGQQYTDPPVA